MNQFVWLIPGLPLAASTISGIGLISFRETTWKTRRIHALLAIAAVGIGLVIATGIALEQFQGNAPTRWLLDWIVTPDIHLEVGYWIDPLTSLMLVVVTSVALLVMIYSDTYMKYDEGYVRFFAYLSLFTTSMLGLILSPNLIQVYAFWELVGMCSYLLIGFWFTRPSAADACQKAFVTNRVGDFGLLLGILALYWMTGSFEFGPMADRLGEWLLQHPDGTWIACLACGLVFLGPIAKSAQFPLHVWLPDAMEGPTPISALIHAATMVAAGIFLVARMFPLFHQLPWLMDIIAWTGTVTAFLGATIALTQSDLKKGLAYSTMSQLGYMMMAMGVGAYSAALFHLVTHAYSKALLFLGSGSVIHGLEPIAGFNPAHNQNMDNMGGLRKFMPITGWTFLLGTCSICGVPPLACFWSKDEILAQTFAHQPLCWAVAWFTAGLTGFYMFRIYFLTFEGTLRANISDSLDQVSPSESSAGMISPLMILSVPTFLIGWLGAPFNNQFEAWIHAPGGLELEAEPFSWSEFGAMAGSSVGIGLIGITLASLMYQSKKIKPWSTFLAPINRLAASKWYIDDLYDIWFVQGTRKTAVTLMSFDQRVIDGTINGTATGTLFTSEGLKYSGSGQVQSYLWLMFAFIALGLIGLFLVL